MVDEKEKEIIGYYTEDENIYCVECINKDNEIIKNIEKAITEEDLEEGLYFCEGCEKEIKWGDKYTLSDSHLSSLCGRGTI